ncbi:MAG: hypothetical protein LBN05_08460 [Oscillospiraceae bacterium]|jgi:hypothetical protein|nr:hypothetical protein [Oscillospiraceae bacterium]
MNTKKITSALLKGIRGKMPPTLVEDGKGMCGVTEDGVVMYIFASCELEVNPSLMKQNAPGLEQVLKRALAPENGFEAESINDRKTTWDEGYECALVTLTSRQTGRSVTIRHELLAVFGKYLTFALDPEKHWVLVYEGGKVYPSGIISGLKIGIDFDT